MPQLGETVTEGTVTKWLKSVGDQVSVDDVLFEVSTDKVDTEVPSAVAGIVAVLYVAEGDTVAIGTRLAAIAVDAEEAASSAAQANDAGEDAWPTAAGVPATEAQAAPTNAAAAGSRGAGRAMTARGSSVTSLRQSATRPVDGSAFLSPAVRALLDEHGLDERDVAGSGRDGRITRADVLAGAARAEGPAGTARAGVAPALTTSVQATGGRVTPYPPATAGPDDDIIEFTRARRATAEHMVRSQATSAHTLVATEVDYARVDAVRRAAKLSFLPFVARATIDALRRFPHLNASVGDDQLIVHRRIHLSVAVDVEHQALVVPVVRDADGLRIDALSEQVAALAERARTKRLTADELTGGTFTVTNVGSYGTFITAPVINQPQVAILSTDGVKMRPVAVRGAAGDWTIAVHPVGNLCLSFDHRAVDGAYASAFLAAVRETIETRDWRGELR